MSDKTELVQQYLQNQGFRGFLKLKGIPVTRSAEELYPYVIEYKTQREPIANDGNLSI